MPTLRLYCPACARHYPLEVFSCPNAGDGGEHALRREWSEAPPSVPVLNAWKGGERRTFALFAPWLSSWQILGVESYADVLEAIDQSLRQQEGRGFDVTPLLRCDELAHAMGRSGALFCKDETGNVTGSHKGRHLMAALLHLEALRRIQGRDKPSLAIYSCGNAALAAAAVARAGDYRLETFVPADVSPQVATMLQERGATVSPQPRVETGKGDPCYLAFAKALRKGAAPFSCSGADTWANIEGGMTMGWELALQLRDMGQEARHVALHIGGGALARAMVLALREARAMGLLRRLPTFHAMQTPGAFPFVRAWALALERCCSALGRPLGIPYDHGAAPEDELRRLKDFLEKQSEALQDGARLVRERFDSSEVREVLRETVHNKGRYMWAWDAENAPLSLAEGILDDETYDWRDVLLGVLETGGQACIASEEEVARANELCRRHAEIRASHTGSAALAGLLRLTASGAIPRGDSVALPITGAER